MEKKGILEKMTKPTDWVNSAVYVKKPGKLRVCLDPRELNKHIKIPKFRLPTMDDVISKLGKVKVFTVLRCKGRIPKSQARREIIRINYIPYSFWSIQVVENAIWNMQRSRRIPASCSECY